MKYVLPILFACLLAACGSGGKAGDSFAEATKGLEHKAGFFDLYVGGEKGAVLAVLPKPDADGLSLRLIYAEQLAAGLGSNPIGLDRGLGDSGEVVRFRRIGAKVVAEQENWRYRASDDNPLEKQAVAESFAPSFLWSSDILATAPDGGLLVDLSGFLTRDGMGLAKAMQEKNANFSLAADRSMPDAASVRAFPDNVEADAYLTFVSDAPGPQVRATAADPNAVTLVQHHSFVRLPDDGYETRKADPRTGTLMLGYYDYSTPLSAPVLNGYAMRHRLQHSDPADPTSPVKKPIVFYVDPGAPEPIRSALIEGASWWKDAFAAAGFPDGYRVEVLPEGADPLDVRYNVIQWVHRQTRGWSYGGAIVDPRTGEMIKGHVILGSQRVRQDRMIFEGLEGTEKTDTGAPDDPVELALDRVRQLAAHETGHALGFGHNFAASTYDRGSVMDYPAPWVRATASGALDFSKAYGVGVGAWDVYTTKWLYTEFPTGTDENAALDAMAADAKAKGLLYVADPDGRGVGTAHPKASVWDNGADPVAELENVMAVRRIALQNFGRDRVAQGRRLSELRQVIAPVYLYHRYQVAAAAKTVGGMSFDYGLRGDGSSVAPAPAAAQRRALAALLGTLDPSVLDIPDTVLSILTPPHDSYWFSAPLETVATRAGPAFDLFAAAETAADLTFDALLDPSRAERLVQFHARDPGQLGLDEVMDGLETAVFDAAAETPRRQAIAAAVEARFVFALMDLDDAARSPGVKARVRARLAHLQQRLKRGGAGPFGLGGRDDPQAARNDWLAQTISAHLERAAPPAEPKTSAPEAPPGSPIGAAEDCWHCEDFAPAQ